MPIASAELYRLGPIDAIPPGEGRAYRVERREIAVFRTRSGEVFATQAHCPHKGAPLADGLTGAGKVVCPFHAYAFDLASGEPVMNACTRLKTYAVAVDAEGEILLSVDDEDQRQPYLG